MEKSLFLFEDKINLIESSFIKKGWITIYESNSEPNDGSVLLYCCIVEPHILDSYKSSSDWSIEPGSEGKPSIISSFKDNHWVSEYHSTSNEGTEPFIFSKRFTYNGGHEAYIDIAEEFVLYFKLYERGANKQDRTFYFVDDSGNLEEVIIIKDKSIKVKLKYLIEYISVRKVHFAVCFDFMRFTEATLKSLDIAALDKNYESLNYFYNHYIRSVDYVKSGQLQSWIRGKCMVYFDETKSNKYHFDLNDKYESFLTGYDDNGNEVLTSCEKTDDKYFILTYFKKSVLNKYYSDPEKYKVTDFNIQSSFFSLKIDNNIQDYVPVFLVELGMLPHKEQMHWKHYNIPPKDGISRTYYRTMIEGQWSEHPETPDSYFKYKYKKLNEQWEGKFGWKFYKPLAKESAHYLDSLHVPTTNSIKSFCEQILALVILTIDSLNESEIGKGLTLEPNIKGIAKLEAYLKSKGTDMPDMIEFLRHLQNLRSGLIAHRFSTSNRSVKKSIDYFGLTEDNRVEVATEIFIKSVFTLNSLEKNFLTED